MGERYEATPENFIRAEAAIGWSWIREPAHRREMSKAAHGMTAHDAALLVLRAEGAFLACVGRVGWRTVETARIIRRKVEDLAERAGAQEAEWERTSGPR